VKRAIDIGLFGELSDPRVAARLAARAEERGWDGFFVWDHIAYRAPVRAVADPWVTLAAVACATSQVRIGALVTPLSRRRVHKVARKRPRWTCSAPAGSFSGPGSAARATTSWSRSAR
jgi:alkanesulfonate monooxygenase SsuD/methylene tetrahydromethanopterin reductase-like flavin-dependent oxidoreductase (luciferase family)